MKIFFYRYHRLKGKRKETLFYCSTISWANEGENNLQKITPFLFVVLKRKERNSAQRTKNDSWPLLRFDPHSSIGDDPIAILFIPIFGPFLVLPASFLWYYLFFILLKGLEKHRTWATCHFSTRAALEIINSTDHKRTRYFNKTTFPFTVPSTLS